MSPWAGALGVDQPVMVAASPYTCGSSEPAQGDVVVVNHKAAAQLRAVFTRPSWRPEPIALCGRTTFHYPAGPHDMAGGANRLRDPYQAIERDVEVTRRCLEVLASAGNPVVIVTNSHHVARDIDLLRILAHRGAARVLISLSSLEATRAHAFEPQSSEPSQRLHAIYQLAEAGIPVGVAIPLYGVPLEQAGRGGIGREEVGCEEVCCEEVPAMLRAAAQAGARFAGYVRASSGGVSGRRRSDGVHRQFQRARRRAGLAREGPRLSAAGFVRPPVPGAQLTLF